MYESVRELLPGGALLMERVASSVEEGAKVFPAVTTGLLVLKLPSEKQPKAYDTRIRKTEKLKQALVSTHGSLDHHSVRLRS